MLVDLPANIVPVLLGHFGGRAAILTKQLLKSALDFVVLFEELQRGVEHFLGGTVLAALNFLVACCVRGYRGVNGAG